MWRRMAWWGARGVATTSIVMVAVLAVGCGSEPRGTVWGTVTYKNKPVKGGTVVFVPEPGRDLVRVPIASDGTYKGSGVGVGVNEVAVEGARLDTAPPSGKDAVSKPLPSRKSPYQADATANKESAAVSVPERYSDPKTSGLKMRVFGGGQKYDIPLK